MLERQPLPADSALSDPLRIGLSFLRVLDNRDETDGRTVKSFGTGGGGLLLGAPNEGAVVPRSATITPRPPPRLTRATEVGFPPRGA